MNIHSGLVGISNNANARQRFFMVTRVFPPNSRVSIAQIPLGSSRHDSTR